MPKSSTVKSILAFVLALPLFGSGSIQPVSPVTVHEWGTFTSVAGPHGESVTWAPRATVDKVLPLKVTPAPKETQRVFVGRVEMLSPWTERTIRAAMRTNDATLDQFERFLAPFLAQIRAKGGLTESPLATQYAQQVAARIDSAPCIQ